MTSLVSIFISRNFIGLILANTILGAAFPMQLVLGALTGLMLASNPALATLPSSIQTLGGLAAAAPFSLLMGRFGRRSGFALGALFTLIGAMAAVQSLHTQNFALLCAAHFLMGAGWSAFQYFRFAASEVVPTNWRPVAISLMLSSLLIAALVGPQIFISAKDALAPIPFAGAYVAIAAIACLGTLPLAIVRMPAPAPVSRSEKINIFPTLRRPAVARAIAIAGLAQGIMVFLMVPTPIAMVGCGFSDATASDVVRWHIVAMFAPSFVTGFFIQRYGAQTVAIFGLLLISCAATAAATGLTEWHFYGSLIVLGLGWNFGFIGATSMLDAAVSGTTKAAVQGVNDTMIALVSTLCAFAAGIVVSSLGWTILAILSATVVVAAIIGLHTLRRTGPDAV